MKNYFLSVTLIFSLLTILSTSQTLSAQHSVDTEKLDRYFTQLSDNDRFMGSVVLMSGEEFIFEEAYGMISDDGIPATPETVYRIGSITKSYTATMILQLIEEGNLSLDTTLGTYFPGMPNSGDITIEQLLRHQSGLANFTDSPDYLTYFTGESSREEMLNRFRTLGTSFAPGMNTEYSNTGYVLLGFIIEEETGQSYADVLQERIAEPLGFSSTYIADGIDPEQNEADSFVFQQGDWQPASRTNMQIPHGAGAVVSTAEEVARFYHGLLNGELLPDELLEEMRSFEGSFGLGLMRFPFGDKTLIGHNGGIDGYRSNSAHYPEDDMTFALLGNGINHTFNDILIGLLSISFGNEFEIPEFEERAAIILDENELEQYTGTYDSPNFPLSIELFAKGDKLMAQATGQGSFPLTIYDETTMVYDPAGIEMQFSGFSDGRYRAFRFTQAGQQFDFSLQNGDQTE